MVEEVHIFAPQSGASLTSDILHRFAKQGRKRGVLLVVASQRTQAVSKELMSQLNFPAIGGFEIERDYDAVKALVDGHTFEEFRALPAGEFFLPAAGRFERWRARHTAHGGDAPSWTGEPGGAPRVADATLSTLIDELREALAAESASAARPGSERRAAGRDPPARAAARAGRRGAQGRRGRGRAAAHRASGGRRRQGGDPERDRGARWPRRGRAGAGARPRAQLPLRAHRGSRSRRAHGPRPGAPALPPAAASGGAVVKVIAKPASPSLRDLAMPATTMLEVRGVKQMVSAARSHARRRSPRSVAHVALAAKLLARGAALTAEELAARGGSRSQVEIRRAAHALAALARAGFASLQGGRHALNEAAVLRAIQSG